jgi:hypothetical protein
MAGEPVEDRKNYCKAGNGMAVCMCAVDKIDWNQCRFKRKASGEDRCMYFREAINDHCDNHKAQQSEYLSIK